MASAADPQPGHGGPLVIENCAIATMDGPRHDDTGAEHRSGHIVVSGGQITAVGEGSAPSAAAAGARRIDGTGCLATPALVNTHHHLYQWLTQGRAQQSSLSGCTTSTDHHYIFPPGDRGVFEAGITAAARDVRAARRRLAT